MGKIAKVLVIVLAAVLAAGPALAADPAPPAPDSADSAMHTVQDLYDRLDTGATAAKRSGAFTEPSAAPCAGATSLNDVMGKMPAADNVSGAAPGDVLNGKTFWGLRTDGSWGVQTGTVSQVDTSSGDAVAAELLSGKKAWVDGAEVTGAMPDNGAVAITPGVSEQGIPAGYHDGSGTVAGDADLASGNIKAGATIFGVAGDSNVVDTSSGDATASDIANGKKAWVDGLEVTGSAAPAPAYPGMVPQTGQTAIHVSGDDGALQTGVAWTPSTRFTDNNDGTVTDNLTGLVWLKNANCYGTRNLNDSLALASGLANGTCGLSDGSSAGDWRVPSLRELHSLIDYSQYGPALPAEHPFDSVVLSDYWTSTTVADNFTLNWYVQFNIGLALGHNKATSIFLWPVRDGQ